MLAAAVLAGAVPATGALGSPSPFPQTESGGGVLGMGVTPNGGRFWVDARADDLSRGGLA